MTTAWNDPPLFDWFVLNFGEFGGELGAASMMRRGAYENRTLR
jgi:hypothetical protein